MYLYIILHYFQGINKNDATDENIEEHLVANENVNDENIEELLVVGISG